MFQKHFGVILGGFGVHSGVTWKSFGHYFGFMTVPLGDFLVTFDVENDVDVHKWWLGGFENRQC